MSDYVHGYSSREGERLYDQATTLADLLHCDSLFPAGSHVLEAGCGVGAQTVILASRNPDVAFTSVDISADSLAQAELLVRDAGLTNVAFAQHDLFKLPYAEGSFDHVFVCFVLEHLPDPLRALVSLKRYLKPGASMTVIEGDHGSTFFHPESPAARKAIQCLIDVQEAMGGDSLIGRRVYPLMAEAGLQNVSVSPRMVYADASRPAMVDGFTRKTFTAMVEGVGESAIARGLVSAAEWNAGIEALYRTAENDGVFCYTFFKGIGSKE